MDIIIKGHRDIEYGHKINLATDKSVLITALMIEKGNPCDTERFIPLIKTHRSLYGCVPRTTIADGGYASQSNIDNGKALGIKRAGSHKKKEIAVSAMGLKEKTLWAYPPVHGDSEARIIKAVRCLNLSLAGMWLVMGSAGAIKGHLLPASDYTQIVEAIRPYLYFLSAFGIVLACSIFLLARELLNSMGKATEAT